ncbi:MAG: FAD-dependent oxidoreductase, partial [Gemmatimonadetes bacterium]|nr:FAD-dependent oxidoreductase [Gemmatimonadota bacterium]
MAAERNIQLFKGWRLEEVTRSAKRVTAIRVRDRATGAVQEFRGQVFIDATYEGDLAAWAGARYRIGRESRKEFNELHAGVVYQDPPTRTFLAGTTGEGDRRVQAYTFRLCLTTDPANRVVLRDPPPEYDRARYLPYIEDWKAGRLGAPDPNRPESGTVLRAFTIAPIPNRKTDLNMYPRALAYPFVEENFEYPEAGWEKREKITQRLRNITLGLLYFCQNDPAVPAEHRALANKYHLAKDEFADNGHFPWQLYVREARRIRGLYTLSERDVTSGPEHGRPPIHHDSITAGEFPIDSMPARRRQPGDDTILEGYLFMLRNITQPYQIPYRIIVPEEVDSLLAPVAASTTHVAFSSIRLEPTWMAL